MFSFNKISPLLGAAVLAIAGLVLPAAASAQGVPAYAQPAYQGGQDETITGRIIAIDDTWHITVADDRGFTDTVELHQGTIINPTGLTLAPGMNVTIDGYGNGPVFEANEIDTPYSYSGPLPVPVYYGAGWWYPGYEYGYGPSFGLFFNFGRIERRDFDHSRPFFGFRDNAYGHGYVAPRDTRFGNRPAADTRNERGNVNTRSNYSTNYSTRNTTNYAPRENYVTRGTTNYTTRNTTNYTTRNTTNYTPRNTAGYNGGSRSSNAGSYSRANYSHPSNNNSHPSNNRGSNNNGGGNRHH